MKRKPTPKPKKRRIARKDVIAKMAELRGNSTVLTDWCVWLSTSQIIRARTAAEALAMFQFHLSRGVFDGDVQVRPDEREWERS